MKVGETWTLKEIANHVCMSMEECASMMKSVGIGHECNGKIYIKAENTTEELFRETLPREASAYVRRLSVLEFIKDNPGCIDKDIHKFLKDKEGDAEDKDIRERIIRQLTDECIELYEGEEEEFYVSGYE